MYAVKEKLDRAVAQHLMGDRCHVVVTMYGSALATLSAARRLGVLGVLNFVNSHPRYQNAYLRELAGLASDHGEMVPAAVAGRVEREVELADIVILPSRFVAKQFLCLGFSQEKFVIEPYGVDLERFRFESRGDASISRRVRCIYVGQISYRKGIPVLLGAARQFIGRPIDFLLIGPLVSPEVLERMPSNTQWHPSIPQQGLAGFMQSADLLVLPSIEDAYGLVVLEGMASGLPVVVTDHAGASENISSGVDGLIVKAGQINELVEALTLLLENPELRLNMGRSARLRLETASRSWQVYGSNILNRLDGIVAGVPNQNGLPFPRADAVHTIR